MKNELDLARALASKAESDLRRPKSASSTTRLWTPSPFTFSRLLRSSLRLSCVARH
jgi:hypothetical protein